MASGIETRTQLYEILDKIQDNLNSNDTYSNMKLYFNEMMKTAVIYQIVGDEGLSNDISIVAIFNPERILLSELEYFKGAILKNVNVINVDSIGINEIGLGGFIDFDRLINNICVALGVKLGKNFAKNNPLIYSELRNICIKYTSSLNNSPYFMQEAGTSYYSLVPYNIVLDVAIYLSNLGLFNVETFPELFESPLGRDQISYIPISYPSSTFLQYSKPISDFYTVLKKSDFLNNHVPNWVNIIYPTITDIQKERIAYGLNAMITQFEDEINWNDIIVLFLNSFNTSKILKISINNFSKDCSFSNSGGSNYYLFNKEDYVVNRFRMELNYSEQTGEWTITQAKDVLSFNSNTYNSINYYKSGESVVNSYKVNNINFNKYIKYYGKYSSDGSGGDNILPYYPYPQENIFHNNLKFIPSKYMGTYLFEKSGIEFSEKDMVITDRIGSSSPYQYCIHIFRNASETGIKIHNNNSYGWLAQGASFLTSPSARGKFTTGYDGWVVIFTFETDVVCETYVYDSTTGNYVLNNTESVSSKQVQVRCRDSSEQGISNNFGEVIEIKPPEVLQDITLESGATYPQDVIDSSTFISTYPNWYRQDSYQPEIDEDGQVLNSRTATTWINLDVDSPSNQSEAQEGNLDNADLDTLIRDVDKAEEGDDTDDPSSDDDAEDEGEIEETDPEDVPSTLIGFLQQLVFPNNQTDIANLGHFMMGLYSNSFLDIIKNLALGNPIEGLVSFVATYDGLWNEDGVTTSDVVMWGQTLTYEEVGGTSTNVQAKHIAHQIKEIDLGTIDMTTDLPSEYTEDNYTDITERELGLYLPFVGMVNLDIRDFIGKQLELKARVDSVTGTIIYNVYSKGDGFKHLNQTFSGNCQSQIPLKSADFSQLMRNIANTSLGAVGALTLL